MEDERVTLEDIALLTQQVQERAAEAISPRALARGAQVPVVMAAGALAGVLASRFLAGKLGLRHGLGTLVAGAAGAVVGIAVVRRMGAD